MCVNSGHYIPLAAHTHFALTNFVKCCLLMPTTQTNKSQRFYILRFYVKDYISELENDGNDEEVFQIKGDESDVEEI